MAVLRSPRFAAAGRGVACCERSVWLRGRPVAGALLLGPRARLRPDPARRRSREVVLVRVDRASPRIAASTSVGVTLGECAWNAVQRRTHASVGCVRV
eukprot:2364855-Alexandrium_andersonii.AAC.1